MDENTKPNVYICEPCIQEKEMPTQSCIICQQKPKELIYDPVEDDYMCKICIEEGQNPNRYNYEESISNSEDDECNFTTN